MRVFSVCAGLLVALVLWSSAFAQDLGGTLLPEATEKDVEQSSTTGDEPTSAEARAIPAKEVQLPPPPDNVSSQFEFVKNGDAGELAQEYVQQKGWRVGWDTDKGWGVFIGTGSLLADDPTGLAVSLNGAMVDAKFQYAEYLSGVIATAALTSLEKNPAELRAERDRMDALAKAAGGNPAASSIRDILDAGGREGEPNVKRRQRVSNASRTAAEAAIPGMMVAKTFVKGGTDGSVAVVLVSTPKSRAVADAMVLGKSFPRAAPDASRTLRAYVDSLSPETLVYGCGAAYRMNEKGELCLLGYGVGSVDGAESEEVKIAELEATEAANFELRNAAGEMVVGSRLLSRVASNTQWVDGKAARESSISLNSTVGTIAQDLGCHGIETVVSKRVRSPVMGDLVCVVRSWNLSSAQSAAELRAQFSAQAGWKGGAGVQPGRSASPEGVRPGAPPPRRSVPSGQGGGGIDEP